MKAHQWSLGAALVALTGALVLVVMLTAQKRELQERYELVVERARSAQPGFTLPPVPLTTLDGAPVTLGEAPEGAVQVLFFYTTTCPHCRATAPAWNRIAANSPDAQVIGVQLDSGSPEEYRATHGLPYQIVAVDSVLGRRLVRWYRVRNVPLTLVVGQDGRIEYSRFGRLEDRSAVDSVLAAVAHARASSPAQRSP